MSHVMNTYARQPVAFVRGEGVWLWDEAGKIILTPSPESRSTRSATATEIEESLDPAD